MPEAFNQLHIVATMNLQVVYTAAINLGISPITGGNIPTTRLPTGILQVTLFDANWVPAAERICFVNNNDYSFQPQVSFDTLGTAKREKNVLVVNVPDSIEANLSVSVADAVLGGETSNGIISQMLLTGDLKGNVYRPDYYFSPSDSAAYYLDLVMLTNGWRRYKWPEVIAGNTKMPAYPADTAYLGLFGNIAGATAKQVRDAGTILLNVSPAGNDSARQFFAIPLDSSNTFSKPGFIFFDTLKVFYRFPSSAVHKLNNTAEISFSSGSLPVARYGAGSNGLATFDTTGYYYNTVLAAQQARLQQLLKTTTLSAVTVKTFARNKLDLMDEKYTNGLFTGGDATRIDVLDDTLTPNVTDVFTYLLGKVPGLQIIGAGTADVQMSWRRQGVAVYVDGIRERTSEVSNVNTGDIAYIKAFPPPFYGASGSNGAIAIYTRKGDEPDVPTRNSPNSMHFQLLTGYTSFKEFYAPTYSQTSQDYPQDLRATLYWNPQVLTTGQNHIIRLPFYNNDVTKSFRVVLEGVAKDGRLARFEQVFK